MYCSSLDDFVCVCMLQREIYDFFFQIIKKKDQNQAPLEFIMGSGLKNVNQCHSLNWIMQYLKKSICTTLADYQTMFLAHEKGTEN